MSKHIKTRELLRYYALPSKRCFGIELECGNNISKESLGNAIKSVSAGKKVHVTGWDQSINNNYWHIKEDSTCGPKAKCAANGKKAVKDYGWEISSYKGKGAKDIKHFCDVVEKLSETGILVNDNCGFHIHIEVKDFDMEKIATLMCHWVKIEKMFCLLVPKRRVGNVFCKLYNSKSSVKKFYKKFDIDSFWKVVCPKNTNINNNPDKKHTLNIVNFVKSLQQEREGEDESYIRKTIELRLPEGTMNHEDVKNWIRLFSCFIESCSNLEKPKDLSPVDDLEIFFRTVGLSDEQDYVLSPALYECKLWALNRILKYGRETIKTKSIFDQAEEYIKNMTQL